MSELPPSLEGRGLQPHPEGGWFRETWRSDRCTVIEFALPRGTFSAWHRVRGADEVWTHVRGQALELSILHPDGRLEVHVLGPDRVTAVVPGGAWQAAAPVDATHGDHVLVTCTVSPPFDFARFDLADASLLDAFPDHAATIGARLPGVTR